MTTRIEIQASDPASRTGEWQGTQLKPVIASLVARTLANLRGATFSELYPRCLEAGASLMDDPLYVDSLERLTLAREVSLLFSLDSLGVDDYLLRYRTLDEWADLAAWACNREDAWLRFATSGSTGEPRRISHPLARLVREAEAFIERLPGINRVIVLVPAQHIYGFIFGMVLPALAGCSVLHGADAQRALHDPRDGDLVVGTPLHWETFCRARSAVVATGVHGLTSTAPCPPALARQVRGLLGAGLTEIYGSSETSGVGYRRDDQAFHLLPWWRPMSGTQVIRQGDADVPVTLPDKVRWTGERAFEVVGRLDGAVQVGGVNVFPLSVARRLAELPAVSECVVRLDTSLPTARLKAFVIADAMTAPETLEPMLRAWCQSHLKPEERPVRYDIGATLPRNELGKLRDW